MVRFSEVGVNAKGCPGFSTVPLRRESRLVFSKARTKDCVKYPVPYLNLVWSTFSHHLASLACVPRCLTAESHLEPTLESAQVPWGCQGHIVLKREHGASRGSQMRERDISSLFAGITLSWVQERPEAFAKQPSNFPSFLSLLMGLLPSQTERPLCQVSILHHFDMCCTRAYLPRSPQQPSLEGEGRDGNPSRTMLSDPWECVNLQFTG